MTTTSLFAPKMTETTERIAALAGAKHFGTEAVTVRQACTAEGDPNDGRVAVVYELLGRHAGGWDILGDSITVTVHLDGTCTISED